MYAGYAWIKNIGFNQISVIGTKTRDPDVYMRIILLRSEIIFQNEIIIS